MNRIIRVNTRTGVINEELASKEELLIGGRHFIAHLLDREVPPSCDPLGRYNKLVFSMGLFADTGTSTSGKISIGGKSPLTGGIKESNTGGYAGRRISRLGIKAIIVEDIPAEDQPKVLFISGQDMKLIPVPDLRYKRTGDTFSALREQFGPGAGFLAIGPAGEMKMAAAGIASVDNRGIQVRYAGRGGLGAIMGSKGLKAVVVEDDEPRKPLFHDAKLLKDTIKNIAIALREDPKSENRKLYGTLDILDMANTIGILPTRNFSVGQFDPCQEMTGPKVAALIKKRGGYGKSGTPCLPGCTIRCSNVFPSSAGEKIVASLQYESLVMLGPNLAIDDLDAIGTLNHLCNEVGLDSIETGAAVGVAMEAGVIPFGDKTGAAELICQVGEGTPLGRIIGQGVVFTGRAFGIRRVPAVKGQAMPAYDPRALKGNGVTYATSPMGADHTAGNTFETVRWNDPLGVENQVNNSRQLQVRAAILDSMGLCLFIRPAFVRFPGLLTDLFKAKFGWEATLCEIKEIGSAVLEVERRFNERAGVSERFQPMPEYMHEEPLPPHNTVFDISKEELEKIWEVPLNTDSF